MFIAALAQLREGKVYPLVVSAEPAVIAAVRRVFVDAILPIDQEVWGSIGDTWAGEDDVDEGDGE